MMNDSIKETNSNNRGLRIFSSVIIFICLVCGIINYSVNQQISWSLYPIGALVMIWAFLAPLLTSLKMKQWISFAGLSITLIPYLFLIEQLSGGGNWFIPLALPIALVFLAALGGSIFAFSQKGISKWYATAIAVFLFGVLANYEVKQMVNSYVATEQNDIYSHTSVYSFALLSALLVLIGFNKKIK